MISVSTEERFVDVGVSTEQRTLNPPTVSTLEGKVVPPVLTVPAPPVVEVRVESTAPVQNLAFIYEQTIALTEWSIPHPSAFGPRASRSRSAASLSSPTFSSFPKLGSFSRSASPQPASSRS